MDCICIAAAGFFPQLFVSFKRNFTLMGDIGKVSAAFSKRTFACVS